MDKPFMFTPADITALCNLILVVAAVGALIINGMKKAKAPNERQDKRLDQIEERLDGHDRYFDKITTHLDNDKKRLDEIESDNRITNRVIIQTLQVLVRHGIDGNNKEELVEANKMLNKYLLDEKWGYGLSEEGK